MVINAIDASLLIDLLKKIIFSNITILEKIIFFSKSINREASIFFMVGLHFKETYIDMKFTRLLLTILTFRLFGPKNMVVQ